MPSITIHNIDDKLYNLLKKESHKKGLSLNKTIKWLLKLHFGIAKKQADDFNEFSGVWTEAEAQEFKKNTEDFNRIDENDWR